MSAPRGELLRSSGLTGWIPRWPPGAPGRGARISRLDRPPVAPAGMADLCLNDLRCEYPAALFALGCSGDTPMKLALLAGTVLGFAASSYRLQGGSEQAGAGRGLVLPQGHDALEVARLRKQVEGLDRGQRVAGGEEVAQVAHLGRRVAGHVDHGARAEAQELAQERPRRSPCAADRSRPPCRPAGNRGPAKIAAASPARKVALVMPFAAAFSRAKATEVSLTSTPATRSNRAAAARANSPLPQ